MRQFCAGVAIAAAVFVTVSTDTERTDEENVLTLVDARATRAGGANYLQ